MSRHAQPKGIRGFAWRLTSFFHAVATGQALPPWDDYWYQNRGFDSAAGMNVSPETAMRLSAVFACVRVRAETFGSSPAIIGKRYPDSREELATGHPLWDVLHNRPNQWQTAFEFFEMMQGHLDLRGNAFARILPGARGAIDQLVPLHPDLVEVYRLPNGRLKYQVRSRFDAEVDYYAQEEIFHMRGLSSDGLVGLSPISMQREMIGRGLAMQDYGARFFANNSKPPGVLEHPGKFKDDAARKKFADSWQQAQSGENAHRVAVLEDGLAYKAIGLSNQDSQFLEGFKLNREEIAGIYRIPPHKIGILERSTNNNIEHQGIEFVTDCMHPIAARWETRINADLLAPLQLDAGDGGEYFVKFKLDGLLRGDLKSRYEAYAIGRSWGWLSANDICQLENRNPIDEEKGGDDYLVPLNMRVAGQAGLEDVTPPDAAPDNSDTASPSDDGVGARASVKLLASENAHRMVRKEIAALHKAMYRATCLPVTGMTFNEAQFHAEAKKFYEQHVRLISQTLKIPNLEAGVYAKDNLRLLDEVVGADAKASAIDWIEDTGPRVLTQLSVEAITRIPALMRRTETAKGCV